MNNSGKLLIVGITFTMAVLAWIAPVAAEGMEAKIMTVAGPIDPEAAGVTLMHEHVFMDYALPLDRPDLWTSAGLSYPETPEKMALWARKYDPGLNHRLWAGWPANRDALLLDDYETVKAELVALLEAGGQTIVDVTPKNMGGDPRRLLQISKETGLNIVMGTGWYQHEWMPGDVDSRSIDDLAAEMIRDITVGIGGTGIRAGIIGEIGAESHPPDDLLHETEVKVLRASARAALLTGASVTLHTLFSPGDPFTPLDILREEGLPASRIIVGHVHAEIARHPDYLRALAETGVYIGFDLIGFRESSARVRELDDGTIGDAVLKLIEWGYADRILLSHDVYSKVQQIRHGGYGFTFVPRHFTAYLRRRGVSEAQIKQIMVDNPRRVLTFVKATARP